ncbi:MAG: hypothetical protein US43_C0002G0005 [Candidatus Levybacteria bacterium GW2011_GWA1_37_16]|nr:MAG: hypothetical protein US43_C0002G0005 [Candidatus Levybacteria bacterium GW2011_GWA1_37_16]KKQ42204.1 MAG: hypothetical protein US59_C0013G0004 [Candidatus Levybacteria bacterium GW2011_GWB1_37_8]
MLKGNVPPQSLKNILPEMARDIGQRTIERQKNLRANEIFLLANSLLHPTENPQPKQTKILKILGDIFKQPDRKVAKNSDEKPDDYRSLPPIPFEFEGRKIKVQLKDHIVIPSYGDQWTKGMSIFVSIGDVGPEEMEIFHIEKEGEHWNPILKMGNRYSVKNRYREEATPEELEAAIEILNFIQRALNPPPKPQ